MRGPQWRRRWALLPQVRGGGGGLGCRARAALGCLQQLMCSLPLNPPLDGAHLTFVCFLPPYSLQPPPWCPRCLPSLPPWPMARCRWAWGAGGCCVFAALSLRNALCPARSVPPASSISLTSPTLLPLPHPHRSPRLQSRPWLPPPRQCRHQTLTRCWTWPEPRALRWHRRAAVHAAACSKQPPPLPSWLPRWMHSPAPLL